MNAADAPGMVKPEIAELPKISDRMSFIYLEHCQLNREDGAITVTDLEGTVHIPAAAISVLILGPGTAISHRAMELAGDAGVSVVWAGEQGVRYYAHGRALNSTTSLLIRQAALVSNQRGHLSVVRQMYSMRFPDEDVSGLTLQQLRGREGSRIRGVYRTASKKWGVKWSGREFNPDDFLSGDPVNQALSAANVCLYGLAHAVITAMGCSPGLGFVHVGHECSFAYDIADLYKAEIAVPISFEMAAELRNDPDGELAANFPGAVRRRVRDAIVENRLLERMVKDIKRLLMPETDEEQQETVYLWDNIHGRVENGKQYRDSQEDEK